MATKRQHEWINLFRIFVDWAKAEHGLDLDDLRERWKAQLMERVEARIASGQEPSPRKARLEARSRFTSHSNLSLWAGVNGAHRRISPANYFIFDDPLVAQFNRGRDEEDRLTIANYIRRTPASTQNVGKRPRARRKAVHSLAAR